MKFKTHAHILPWVTALVMFITCGANAGLISIDATKGNNPDEFLKFDESLGNLVNVTWFHKIEVSFAVYNEDYQFTNGACGPSECVYLSYNFNPSGLLNSADTKYVPRDSYDQGETIVTVALDLEFNVPVKIALNDFTPSDWFTYALINNFDPLDGNKPLASITEFEKKYDANDVYTGRVLYMYEERTVVVSSPATFALFSFSMLGLALRRYKKQLKKTPL
ncbi:MAG: hypothetical protein ACJASL_003820 [Paraglaciecola sp.]|jgi:hypothetical protein